MDTLDLDLDFSKTTRASLGIGLTYPPRGFYAPTVKEYKVFEEQGGGRKLYAYMQTENGLISDNFDIGNDAAMARLAGHLISIGIKSENVLGKVGKVPFHKFVGKTAHVHYTPPLLNNGVRVDGSWPKTKYFTKAEWEAAKATDKVEEKEEPVKTDQIASNGKADKADTNPAPVIEAAPATTEDDDWLK